ncbi:MAG: ribonuclease J [Alphaproteobacteria bacterium]
MRIVPLGGLGEVGLNMLLVECEGAAIAIDCGVLFPERPGLGIDLLLPDVTYLRERPGLLRGVVLTHGHEDHIGALPRLLSEFPVPVFGPRFATLLAREKLRRRNVTATIETVEPGVRVEIGPFGVEPIHMTHSIVDSVALAITTPQGAIIHTGDFKIDPRPVDGRTSDTERLAEWGRRGVLLLLSDSTNAEHDGECGSESDVGPRMEEIIRGVPGRAWVTTFASHLHRVQQVVDASTACGRRVAVAGRGFEDSTRLAGDVGYLRIPPGGFVSPDEAMRLDPGQVTVLVSGSQGEPTSALSRLSDGQFKQYAIGEGDAVILSSRVIPGNERSVHSLLNRLAKRGAIIHAGDRAGVHVSGHAYRDELRTMIQLVRPRFFVPVHGEYRHLVEHRRLAADTGLLPLDRCLLLEDGDVLELDDGVARVGEKIVAGRVLVDGTGEGDVDFEVLHERRHLSEDGFVVAVIAIHQQTGEITSGPELITRGVLSDEIDPAYLDEAKAAVLGKLREITPESRADLLEVEDEVRRTLKKFFSKTRGRRPLIVPHVFEM